MKLFCKRQKQRALATKSPIKIYYLCYFLGRQKVTNPDSYRGLTPEGIAAGAAPQ